MNKKFEALINKLAVILSKRSDRLNVIDKFDKCLDELAGADYTAKADYVKLTALLKSQGSHIQPKKDDEKEQEELKSAIDGLESKVIEMIQGLSGKLDNLEDKLPKKEDYQSDQDKPEQEDERKEEEENKSTTEEPSVRQEQENPVEKESAQESANEPEDKEVDQTDSEIPEDNLVEPEDKEEIYKSKDKEEVINKIQESSENISDDIEENTSFLAEKLDSVLEDTENIDGGIETREEPELPENKPIDKGQDKASEKVTEAIKTNTKENVKSSNKYSKALEAIKGIVSSIGKSVSKNLPVVILGILLLSRLLQKAWESVRESVVGFAKDVWDAIPEWIRKPIRFIYNGVKLSVSILKDLVSGTKLKNYLEEHGGMDKMIADKQAEFEAERQENWDKARDEHDQAVRDLEEARASGASDDVLEDLETKAYDTLHKVQDAEVEYEASHADAVIAVQEELKEETGMINRWHAYAPEKFKGYREWYRDQNAGKFQTELQQFTEYLTRDRKPWWEYTGDSDGISALENVIYEQDISEDEFYDNLDNTFSNDQIKQMWDLKSRGNTEQAGELFWNFIERNTEKGTPENVTDSNGVVGTPGPTSPEIPSQVSPLSSIDGEVQEFNKSQGQQVVASSNKVTAYYINNVKNDNYNLYG